MKKIKYINIALFMLFFVVAGCESDEKFLEEKPSTFYTVDNAFSSSAQVDQVLVSIYSQIRDLRAKADEWIVNLKGKGTDMYDVAVIRRGLSFSDYSTINPDNGTFYQAYSTFYYIIARANLAIYAAELPNVTWGSEAEKSHALAQARFFRAFAYRNLGELFGGVPIVTDISTSPRYDFEPSSRVGTYQFAIDEMEAIVNDLPETTSSGGRLVRGAAQHNLCQLYLALGTQLAAEGKSGEAAFQKSVSYGDKVIDGGKFSLVQSRFGTRLQEETVVIDVYKSGVFKESEKIDTVQMTPNHYWDLFQEGNVNYQDGNPECIWALQTDYQAFKAEDRLAHLPYAGTYGPVIRDIAGSHANGTLENVGGRGICLVNITMYARDLVYEDKWGDDMRNSEIVMRRRIKGNMESSPYYKKIVPWDVMYGFDKDPVTILNNTSEIYPISCKIAADKFTGVEDGQNRSNLFRDDYHIRLSETILLRAEAKQRLGNKSGAAADVNLLRDRAQCGYRVTASDMDDQFNMILDERARELIYEEFRWNTLLRMGGTIAADRIKKYAHWPVTKATLTFNYNLWPIPQTIIDTNKDVDIPQNPGWTNR